MIKNNNLNLIPKSVGITKIIKTFKGTDLVWEVIKVAFEGSTKSLYIINISNTSAIKPGKVYSFTTSKPYNNYKLAVDGKEYNIKNGTTFSVDYNCEIKISNLDYNYFDIKICEADGNADIKIKKQPEVLVYTKSGSIYYNISINNWSDLMANKNYRFTTNIGGHHAIISNGVYYPLRDKEIFTVRQNCDIKIMNTDYNLFELKIYETTDTATIIF